MSNDNIDDKINYESKKRKRKNVSNREICRCKKIWSFHSTMYVSMSIDCFPWFHIYYIVHWFIVLIQRMYNYQLDKPSTEVGQSVFLFIWMTKMNRKTDTFITLTVNGIVCCVYQICNHYLGIYFVDLSTLNIDSPILINIFLCGFKQVSCLSRHAMIQSKHSVCAPTTPPSGFALM